MQNIPWKTIGIVLAVLLVGYLAYTKLKAQKEADTGEPAKKEG